MIPERHFGRYCVPSDDPWALILWGSRDCSASFAFFAERADAEAAAAAAGLVYSIVDRRIIGAFDDSDTPV